MISHAIWENHSLVRFYERMFLRGKHKKLEIA